MKATSGPPLYQEAALKWLKSSNELTMLAYFRRWLGDVDSNHDKQSQSLLSYR